MISSPHTHTDVWRGINPDCKPQSLVQISRTHTVGKLTHRTQWKGTSPARLSQMLQATKVFVMRACVCVCSPGLHRSAATVCRFPSSVRWGLALQAVSLHAAVTENAALQWPERETDSEKESLNTGTLQKKRALTVGTYHKALSPPVYEENDGKGLIATYGWSGDVRHWWTRFFCRKIWVLLFVLCCACLCKTRCHDDGLL